MRSRIRTIKPEAATDEELWDLNVETGMPVQLAFYHLWCWADREGRFEWRPRALKVHCLPYWDGDFSRVLDALTSRGFIVRYECDGRSYGLIRNFKKHQAINNKEEASKLPPPPGADESAPKLMAAKQLKANASSTREPRDSDAAFSLPSGTERNGTERNGTAAVAAGARARTAPAADPQTRPDNPKPEPKLQPAPEPEALAPPRSTTRASPGSYADLLLVPIVERAQWLEANKHHADWANPKAWPEIVELAETLHVSARLGKPRLGHYLADTAVQRLVALYAAGFSQNELTEALRRIPAGDWWRAQKDAGKRPGLHWLTLNVVRTEVAALPRSQPVSDRVLKAAEHARRRAERERKAEVSNG